MATVPLAVRRGLLKSLLQVSKRFDANPTAKAFLIRSIPKKYYDRGSQKWETYENEERNMMEDRVLDQYLGEGANFYQPGMAPPSLTDFIRQQFHEEIEEGSMASVEYGFAALKLLNETWELGLTMFKIVDEQPPPNAKVEEDKATQGEGEEGEEEHPMSFLLSTTCSENGDSREVMQTTDDLQRGIFLLGHPMCISASFGRAVMLLAEHDQQQRSSMAFIINKPTDVKLGQVLNPGSDPKVRRVTETFQDQPIYIGGPCETPLAVLHPFDELDSVSHQVCDGLFYGGQECIEKAHDLIEEGHATPSDFKLIIGTALWGKDQLLGELEQKLWILAQSRDEETTSKLCLNNYQSWEGNGQELNLQNYMVSPDGAHVWGMVI